MNDFISDADLALYVADPLLEEKRGLRDVIICRICGAPLQKLPQHLIAKHSNELAKSGNATPHDLVEEYRRRFGYNKRAPLCSASVREVLSKATKRRNSFLRHQGRQVSPHRFRRGRAPIEAARQARENWGISKQQHQRMSIVRKNIGRPAFQKLDLSGKRISDWQMARIRLAGSENFEISKKLDFQLAATSVHGRLRRIGFPPGKACLFYRGEPVSEKLLKSHFEDIKFLRTSRPLLFRGAAQNISKLASGVSIVQAAEFLGVTKSWLHEHTRSRSKFPVPHRHSKGALLFNVDELLQWALARRNGKNAFLGTFQVERELGRRLGLSRHRVYEFIFRPGGPRSPRHNNRRKVGHPLSVDLARKLLASIASLREEFRRCGPTGMGGRPKALLPSEERELPHTYVTLVKELTSMLHWAEAESEPVTLDRIGEWLCQQSRCKAMKLLLFWPSVHNRLAPVCQEAQNRVRGGFGAAERAKELLAHEFNVSRSVLERSLFRPNIADQNSATLKKNPHSVVAHL